MRASSHLHSGGSVMVCISVSGVMDLVRQPTSKEKPWNVLQEAQTTIPKD